MAERTSATHSPGPKLPRVEVNGVDCTIVFQRYESRRRCLRLIADDEPYMCATVNVPDVPLSAREILIKNWEENTGVLEALVEAGIVEATNQTIAIGQQQADVVRLLIEPLCGD